MSDEEDYEPEKVYSYEPEDLKQAEVKKSDSDYIRSMSSNRQAFFNFSAKKKKN